MVSPDERTWYEGHHGSTLTFQSVMKKWEIRAIDVSSEHRTKEKT